MCRGRLKSTLKRAKDGVCRNRRWRARAAVSSIRPGSNSKEVPLEGHRYIEGIVFVIFAVPEHIANLTFSKKRLSSLLLNITREVFGPLIVSAFCQFSLSSLKEGIAPRLCTKLPLNLQQKAKKTLIGLLAT